LHLIGYFYWFILRCTDPWILNLDFKPFCRVMNVACFLLGNSPVSEFYMPTFRNTLFHLRRWIRILHTYLPLKMEQTECSETLAYKIKTLGNYPEESIQHNKFILFILQSKTYFGQYGHHQAVCKNKRKVHTIVYDWDLKTAHIYVLYKIYLK